MSRIRGFFQTIAGQILTLFAVATLLPLGVALLQTHSDVQVARERAAGQAQALARAAAGDVQESLETVRRLAKSVGRLPVFAAGSDLERAAVLQALAAPHAAISSLAFVPLATAEAEATIAAPLRPLSAAERSLAAALAASGAIESVGEGATRSSDGTPRLLMARAVRDASGSELLGFLVAELNPGPLPFLWTDVGPLPGSRLLLLDRERGMALTGVIAGADGGVDIISPAALRGFAVAGLPGAGWEERAGVVRAVASIDGTPWQVAALIPADLLLGNVYREGAQRAAGNLLITLAGFLQLLWLWNRIAARRSALLRAAMRWGRTDWRYRAGVRGHDELGTLGVAFDDMAAQVQATIQRDELILEAAGEGILEVDHLRRVVFVNPAACRMLGRTAEELCWQPWAPFASGDGANNEPAPDGLDHTLGAGTVHQGAATLSRADGTAFPVEYISSPIEDDEAVRGAVIVFRDVTEQRKLEQAKDEFVSVVSHELRTPLSSVIAYAELLNQTALTDDQRSLVEALDRSGQTLFALINDVLDYSKIAAQKLDLESLPLSVEELVENAAALIAERAFAKDLDLATCVDPRLSGQVLGDGGRLLQVLLNLLGNAVKFTERGAVTVQATIAAEGAETVEVRFAVEDSGIGIAPDAQGRMFQVFSQADSTMTRRFGGTGLGLAISKRLVELMGGSIGFRSEQGVGTTFWFTVPLARPSGSAVVRPLDALAGRRALVMAAQRRVRQLLCAMLDGWGVRSVPVGDARSALAAWAAAGESSAFDIVLLDHHLPSIDGLVLARAMASAQGPARARFVLLQRPREAPTEHAAHAAGVTAVLSKPVRQRELGAALTAAERTPAAVRAPTPPARLPAPQAKVSRGRVLIVDDQAANRALLRRVLDAMGYEAMMAEDGPTTVAALAETRFAAVFMDFRMPGEDGLSLTSRLRRDGLCDPATPIIVLSAETGEVFRERCLAAGAQDYVAKPFRMAELERVLERWVDGEGLPLAAARAVEAEAR